MITWQACSLSLLAGLTGAWFMSRFAFRLGLVDVPNDRSSHVAPTARGGGVGILFAFVCSSLWIGLPLVMWLPAGLLAAICFVDDKLDLPPKIRFLFQFAAALTVSYWLVSPAGVKDFAAILAAAVFIAGTANFYNFMDGINGIAGGTGVVGYGLVAAFAGLRGEEAIMAAALAISCACLGFLPLNVPRARVFMGDVGSVLLGFMFAVFVLFLAKTPTDFLILGSFLCTFYADALSTLYIRWRAGERLSQAHRRHLYQVMANKLQMSHWKVAALYTAVQLVLGVLLLTLRDLSNAVNLSIIVFYSIFFCVISFVIRKLAGQRS